MAVLGESEISALLDGVQGRAEVSPVEAGAETPGRRVQGGAKALLVMEVSEELERSLCLAGVGGITLTRDQSAKRLHGADPARCR